MTAATTSCHSGSPPAGPPSVSFTPRPGIDVEAKGAWSSVVGALGTLSGESPGALAQSSAKDQGGHQLHNQLADGLSVTINLCTGLSRFHLGREPRGSHEPAGCRARPGTSPWSFNRALS